MGARLPLLLGLAVLMAVGYRLALAHAAIAGVSRTRLRQLGEAGNRRAATLATLLGQRDAVHGALRLAYDAVLVGCAAVCWHLLAPAAGWWLAAIAALGVPLAVELVPRVIASRRAESTALRQARWVVFWFRLLGPLVRLALREPPRDEADEEAAEESIRELVDSTPLAEERRRRITDILEFPEKSAGDVMIPRVDMIALGAEATLSEAATRFVEAGVSRLPIFADSRDEIVGIVHVKEVVRALPSQAPALTVARPPTFVAEDTRLDLLLRELRNHRSSLAIVIDEFGGTAGLVTVEDIIEEIVGDIADESDPIEAPLLRPRDDGGWIVPARMALEELADELALALPDDDDVQTVGGLLMSLAEDVPRAGEVAVCDCDGGLLLLLLLGIEGTRLSDIAVMALEDRVERGEEEPPVGAANLVGGAPWTVAGDLPLAELARRLDEQTAPSSAAQLGDLLAFWPAGSRVGRSVYWRSARIEVTAEDADGALALRVSSEDGVPGEGNRTGSSASEPGSRE